MINEDFEKEYDKTLRTWQKAFADLHQYEKSITVNLNGTNYTELDEKYSELLEIEEHKHRKLNNTRRKFFGLKV